MPPVIRRRSRDEDSGEWQLTLADMMTLILCFFVIIAGVSALDSEKYQEVAKSMSQAMSGKDAAQQSRQDKLTEIERELKARVTAGKETVEIERRPDAIALNLRGPVFFGSGSAELKPDAQQLLAQILGPLLNTPYTIAVEGHTDDVPINSERFPSNWELSAARAAAVARFLIDKGLSAQRVQVLGLADTRPLQPNRDRAGNPLPDNQAMNRRVTILFKP